jgi:opacity protein-like surface antigen
VTRRTDDLGWIGNFAVTYGSDYTNGSLSFNHDVIPVSGSSATNLRTGVSANLSERFTRELSAFIGLGYYWNRSTQTQLATRSTDEKTLTFNGGLRYDFSEYLYLEGNYRYNTIEYKNSPTQAAQNVFMLRLTMRRDLMYL